MAQQDSNWRQFQGTELGSVLAGIYGNKPKINYPKPKPSKKGAFDATKQKFQPVNAKVVHGASDPRKITRRDTSRILAVPQGFNGGQERRAYHPIQFINHRKSASEIKQEMEIEKDRMRSYRPAPSRRFIDETEKDRSRNR